MRTCEAMGLYNEGTYVPAGAIPIKIGRNIGQGSGYEHTKRILTSIGSTLSALSWLAFLLVALGVCTRAAYFSDRGRPFQADRGRLNWCCRGGAGEARRNWFDCS